MTMVEQLLTRVDALTANANKDTTTVDNGQTPMRMSIDTPDIPAQQGYTDVINSNDVKSATATQKVIITIISNGIIRRPMQPPNIDSSSDSGGNGYNAPYINNVGVDNGGQGNGGGDDEPGDSGTGGGKGQMRKGFGYCNKRMEFTFVKSSNITINTFSGSNFNAYPYLPFCKSTKRLIYNQGDDGEILLDILTQVETWGAESLDNAKLAELARQHPKASEFNRAIMSVLLNYISGNAKAMVEYGADNGFDAWRRFYNHYLPLAADLQQISIQQLYSLTRVTENNIGSLVNNVERITELYTCSARCGSE